METYAPPWSVRTSSLTTNHLFFAVVITDAFFAAPLSSITDLVRRAVKRAFARDKRNTSAIRTVIIFRTIGFRQTLDALSFQRITDHLIIRLVDTIKAVFTSKDPAAAEFQSFITRGGLTSIRSPYDAAALREVVKDLVSQTV